MWCPGGDFEIRNLVIWVFIVTQLWAYHLISLSLSFLISKIEEFLPSLPLTVLGVIQRVMHKTVFEN